MRRVVLRRLGELVAILFIGDGVVGMIAPQRHSMLWYGGPTVYKQVMHTLLNHPQRMRLLAAAECVFGLWLALRQYSKS